MMLVVGLGNPGRNYAATRHNAGGQCVEQLARACDIRLERRSRHALIGEGRIDDAELVLARPRSYMNRSGESVRYLMDRFGITPRQLLVLYDDLDLPLGAIRIRPRGSPGGHKGMLSIVETLETQEFPRLRLGIGRPPPGVDEVVYVLGAFSPPEEEVMREVRERAAQAVRCVLAEGLDTAMNRFNAGPPEPEPSQG